MHKLFQLSFYTLNNSYFNQFILQFYLLYISRYLYYHKFIHSILCHSIPIIHPSIQPIYRSFIHNYNVDVVFILFYFSFAFPLQVGRSSESPIDFVVMDTLPGDKKDAKVMQSTISRFACRILVNRCEPSKARIFAAGFDSSRNIFLGVSIFYTNLFMSHLYIHPSMYLSIYRVCH